MGKMTNKNRPSLIAIAVGALVLGVTLALIALAFPAATTNVLLDIVLWLAGAVLWWGLFESRGYRNLVIGVFGLPLGLYLFKDVAGELVSALAATGFAGWLVIGVVRKARLQKQIARYLGGVALTWLGFAVVLPLMGRDNKFHAALAFMLAASLYLAWRNWVGSKAPTSHNAPDPWRWSRDKDGN